LALRRVTGIVDYISRDRPDTAVQWAEGLFDLVSQLESFPGRGRIVPEVGRPDIRELLYGEYRVVYKVQAASVGVLTVRHGRRRFEISEVRRRR
jgi:plasmid stabilization system protein ParE